MQYRVTFYYTWHGEATDSDHAEELAWEHFHEECDSSHFVNGDPELVEQVTA
jgi:hypothetical protein